MENHACLTTDPKFLATELYFPTEEMFAHTQASSQLGETQKVADFLCTSWKFQRPEIAERARALARVYLCSTYS